MWKTDDKDTFEEKIISKVTVNKKRCFSYPSEKGPFHSLAPQGFLSRNKVNLSPVLIVQNSTLRKICVKCTSDILK